MKLKSLFVAALAACATAVASAADSVPLIFNGILTLGKEQRFGLVNDSATKTGWQKLGDEFEGYTLKSYDAATRTLEVERAGKVSKLALASESFSGESVAQTKATLADAEAVIGQINFEKMLEKSLEGQKKAMANMMRQQAAQSGGKFSAEDAIEHQNKVMAVMLEAMNPEQMKKDMAQIYSQTFSKEELAAMAKFNTTPAGQAMIDKMPEIQQKTQELMMPRMMQAMPKIQAMSKEFGRQQAEKAKAQADAAKAAAPAAPTAPTTPAAPAAGAPVTH